MAKSSSTSTSLLLLGAAIVGGAGFVMRSRSKGKSKPSKGPTGFAPTACIGSYLTTADAKRIVELVHLELPKARLEQPTAKPDALAHLAAIRTMKTVCPAFGVPQTRSQVASYEKTNGAGWTTGYRYAFTAAIGELIKPPV